MATNERQASTSQGAGKPIARLILRSGPKAGHDSYPLPDEGSVVLGRDPAAGIQILDELMSRTHTSIEVSAGTYYIVDMRSSNGTFVNGRRIERAALKTGDSILLGRTRLEFVAPGEEGELERRAADQVQLVDDAGVSGSSTSVIKRAGLDDLRRGGKDAAARAAHRALKTIYEVGNLINAQVDLDRMLGAVMDSVFQTFKVERAVLFLDANGRLESRIVKHQSRAQLGEGARVSRTVIEQCRNEGVSILSSDAMMDERFRTGDSILLERIRSLMCVPLASKDRVLGVIYVDNRGLGGAYVERDLELLAAIGKQAGIAVERARLHQELKSRLVSSFAAMISTFEARSPLTEGHSERVGGYAYQLARELGYDDARAEAARLAGLLHDVGSMLLPDEVLLARTPLDEAARALFHGHATAGARAIASVPGMEEIAAAVGAHHERFDGSGYPAGTSGEEIPVLARLVGLVNAYDALLMGRPGQAPVDAAGVAAQLRAASGKGFDPTMTQAFLDMIESGRLQPERAALTRNALWP